jgi:hypothetical protein
MSWAGNVPVGDFRGQMDLTPSYHQSLGTGLTCSALSPPEQGSRWGRGEQPPPLKAGSPVPSPTPRRGGMGNKEVTCKHEHTCSHVQACTHTFTWATACTCILTGNAYKHTYVCTLVHACKHTHATFYEENYPQKNLKHNHFPDFTLDLTSPVLLQVTGWMGWRLKGCLRHKGEACSTGSGTEAPGTLAAVTIVWMDSIQHKHELCSLPHSVPSRAPFLGRTPPPRPCKQGLPVLASPTCLPSSCHGCWLSMREEIAPGLLGPFGPSLGFSLKSLGAIRLGRATISLADRAAYLVMASPQP